MIYVLEDDPSIRKLVTYAINSHGMESRGFERPSQFWEAMQRQLPSLILLDIMLPEEDGLQILKRLRSTPSTFRTPVIMLTAKETEYDKVTGLDAGADDYIAKPFGILELMARIRAVLRHSTTPHPGQGEHTFGPLYLNSLRHKVTVNGREITLTLKEFQVLELLMSHQDAVLTREQLLGTVWGYELDGASRTVDVHIRTLRQKLEEAGALIETVRGVGYRLSSKSKQGA